MSPPQPRTEHWIPNPDPSSIVIPGVDATASVNDQIDQIDQLITIRLQNIDANFSRIQHLISTKLLPAFKRYAEGTELVRESARFWKSFYEAAAQVRIPIANDTSSLFHTENEDSDTRLESPLEPDTTPSIVNPHDDSFARGAPVSSTPLIRDPIDAVPSRNSGDDESWAASIESPFERLGRQVEDLKFKEAQKRIEDLPTSSALPKQTPGTLYSRYKEKSPLRHNVLRQNAVIAATSGAQSTPLQQTPGPHRTRTPKNPFLPPGSTLRQWNGLVDLRQPSPAKSGTLRVSRMPGRADIHDGNDSDSSDDLFPPGMSPPVTMQFAMPSHIQRSAVKLALTPARKAAERISHDLVIKAAAKGADTRSPGKSFPSARIVSGDPSVSSVAPSLPSLTRYSEDSGPALLSAPTSAMNLPRSQKGDLVATPEQQIYRARLGPQVFAPAPDSPSTRELYPGNDPGPRRLIVHEESIPSPGSDSSSDSKSSEHDESNPSAAFLAEQNNARVGTDDSFESSQHSMSSDDEEDDVLRAARHPLAHLFAVSTGGPVEDSFVQDNSFANAQGEEQTVFGSHQVGRAQGERRLQIMGAAMIDDDTYPGAPSLYPFAQVEHTPTPHSGNAGELL